MSDESYYDEDGNPVDETPRMKDLRQQIKDRDKRIKDLEPSAEELQTLKRDIAVRDAGLQLNDRQRKALLATHDGDFNADEIRKTAVDLGFAQPPEPSAEDAQRDADARAQQQIARSASGSEVTPLPDQLQNAIAGAKSQEEVMELLAKAGRATSWNRPS